MKKKLNYCPAIIIVHGKSELCMMSSVKSKLHLPIEIESKNKGENSIQITSILSFLEKGIFKSRTALLKKYNIEVKDKKLNNFKVFIIMDTDDCTDTEKMNFINKSMFKNHWLYEYIVPIYNSPNLEKVMSEAKIVCEKVHDKDKVKTYVRVFPIKKDGKVELDDIKAIRELSEKIRKCKSSNLEKVLDYCIDHCKEKTI